MIVLGHGSIDYLGTLTQLFLLRDESIFSVCMSCVIIDSVA